jgi:hypothetical protein
VASSNVNLIDSGDARNPGLNVGGMYGHESQGRRDSSSSRSLSTSERISCAARTSARVRPTSLRFVLISERDSVLGLAQRDSASE